MEGKAPNCEKCAPKVHEYNRLALELWPLVRGQWRFSFAGPEALDIAAVEAVFRMKNLHDPALQNELVEQLLTIGDVVVDEIRKKQEADSKAARGKKG